MGSLLAFAWSLVWYLGIPGDLGSVWRTCVFILLCCCTITFIVRWLMMSLNRQAVVEALVLG